MEFAFPPATHQDTGENYCDYLEARLSHSASLGPGRAKADATAPATLNACSSFISAIHQYRVFSTSSK